MFISVNTEKTFDKIQHSFMIKTLKILGIEGTYLNIIKAIQKLIVIIELNGENQEVFPLKLGMRQVV
jgi:hypothetical protein